MRRRQKVILSLLLQSQTRPTRTQLMKWLFLLRWETGLRDDPTFYDFVPYRYGPFSFEAYRDLRALTEIGLLQAGAPCISLDRVDDARRLELELPGKLRQAVSEIMLRYGTWSTSRLRATVYARYPWYASRSELRGASQATREGPPAVYTIGYEGKSVDLFLDVLLHNGIRTLIDVRSCPVSRKYSFSGNALQRVTAGVRVRYLHLPELGIDSALRRGAPTFSVRQRLLDHYEQEILPKQCGSVEQVAGLMASGASALMCFEADVRCCHRGRLAARLGELTRLQVVHL